MSDNSNEVMNFEQLYKKYLKDNDQLFRNYDYNTPLKEITPIEPLIFKDDFFPRNNIFKNIYNYNPRFNKKTNRNIPFNENNKNNLIDQMNDENNTNKFITPLKRNNKNNSNINSSFERDNALKEERKRKQLEYQKMLDEQIKEKKLRLIKEKEEERLKDELFFEQKMKLENEKYKQKNKNMNENKNYINLFSGELQIKPQIPQTCKNLSLERNIINKKEDKIGKNIQNKFIRNTLKKAKSQKYLEIMNKDTYFQNQNLKHIRNIPNLGEGETDIQENFVSKNKSLNKIFPQQQIPVEYLISESSQIPIQLLYSNNQNNIQYKDQNNYYSLNRQNQILSQNNLQIVNNMNYLQSQQTQQDLSLNNIQRQYYDDNGQKFNRISDLNSNPNISITPSNFSSSYGIPLKINQINSNLNPANFNNNNQNAKEILNMNINNQNYIEKIMEIFFHEQEKIVEGYKETIKKLKNERDEAIYRNRANEEKILALQKLQNDQEYLKKNLGYFPLKNNYQENMEKTLDSIMQKNEDLNENNENKYYINENENKKFEQSQNNNDIDNYDNINNSNISDSKLVSLITSSKLVKVNVNGNNKKLLETWKTDNKKENEKNNYNNCNIKEVIYKKNEFNNNNEKSIDNNGINNKENEKNRLSANDTNAFMEKINLINNIIFRPSDEIQKNSNENLININSKIKKSNDNSFIDELNIKKNKEEIININKDKKEINNKRVNNDKKQINNKININNKRNISNNYINNDKEKINKYNNYNYYENNNLNHIKDSGLKFQNSSKNKNFILNNVHNAVMKNLDNNLTYSTQIKERIEEEKRKQLEKINNKLNKIDIIPEIEKDDNEKVKENGLIQNKVDEEKKKIYQNYSFKNVNCSSSKQIKKNDNLNPSIKNIDNNLQISKSQKNCSIFVSKHITNKSDIVFVNNEEEQEKGKNTNKNKSINNQEEINNSPNLDSPKNNNKNDINKNENNILKKEKKITDRSNIFEDNNNILSNNKQLDKKESKNIKKYNILNTNINDFYFKKNYNIKKNKNNLIKLSKHNNISQNNLTEEKISSHKNLKDEFPKKNKVQIKNSIENYDKYKKYLHNEILNTSEKNIIIKNNKFNKQNYNKENKYSYLDDDEQLEDEKFFNKVSEFTKIALNQLK